MHLIKRFRSWTQFMKGICEFFQNKLYLKITNKLFINYFYYDMVKSVKE